MAVQLINKSKRLVTFCPSLGVISQRLRTFSSSGKRLPQRIQIEFEDGAGKDGANGTETISLWPDPYLDFLSPKEKQRLPLPGHIGFVTEQQLSQKLQKEPVSPAKSDLFSAQLAIERHRDSVRQAIDYETKQENSKNDKEFMNMLECVAQECPLLIISDFADLFPNHNVNSLPLTVVTLSQKTKKDMSEWNEDVETEREDVMINFVTAAEKICEKLSEAGFWADFIDPFSGKPFLGPHTNATMFETDERYGYFGFTIEDLGCCKVIKHHLWGSHVFVGCIFTNAPVNAPIMGLVLAPGK